jgi:hypothetical protein
MGYIAYLNVDQLQVAEHAESGQCNLKKLEGRSSVVVGKTPSFISDSFFAITRMYTVAVPRIDMLNRLLQYFAFCLIRI